MVALTKLPYWLCRNEVPDEQLGEVFLREVIQTTVAYGCRDMIVALAPYKSPELHVDIFGWMVFAVLLEFTVECLAAQSAIIPTGSSNAVFTYFNMKLSLFIVEIALDSNYLVAGWGAGGTNKWGLGIDTDPKKCLAIIFWMLASMGLIVYYNIPWKQRYAGSDTQYHKKQQQVWEIVWWSSAGLQMLMSALLLGYVIWKNHKGDDGGAPGGATIPSPQSPTRAAFHDRQRQPEASLAHTQPDTDDHRFGTGEVYPPARVNSVSSPLNISRYTNQSYSTGVGEDSIGAGRGWVQSPTRNRQRATDSVMVQHDARALREEPGQEQQHASEASLSNSKDVAARQNMLTGGLAAGTGPVRSTFDQMAEAEQDRSWFF